MTTSSPSSPHPSMAEVNAQLAAQQRRREIARMGALAMHAKHDGKAVAARTMEGRMRAYRERVDPTGELAKRDPQELARRAEYLLKLDMARVRYAKREREAERAKLHDMVRRTPSDDLPMLGAELVALEMNGQTLARLEHDALTLRAMQNETASAETEAAPSPQISGNTQKIVSSDGGEGSVSHAPRRRQTSPATSPKRASKGSQQKATKNHADSNTRALN